MIAKLLSCVVLLCFLPHAHAQLREQSRRESTERYKAFELPATDEWIGESKTVKYEPPRPAANGSWRKIEIWSAEGSGGAAILYWEDVNVSDDDWIAPPIKLESFEQNIASDAQATVGESDDVRTSRTTRSGSSDDEFPLYANVVSESGITLANSLAYSQLEGSADEYTVQAHGKVGTYADILSSLHSEASMATATSSSSFKAVYKLTEEFDFVLDTTLSSQLVDGGYSFRLRDVSTDIDLISLQPEDGQSHRLELCGTLSPGTYELIVDTESTATTNTSGPPDFGGLGEFDFYFRAIALDVERDPSSNSVGSIDDVLNDQNAEWRPIDVWLTDAKDLMISSVSSVPEPSARGELLIPSLLLVLAARKRNGGRS